MKKRAPIMMILIGFYLELYLNNSGAKAEIGINWGRLSSQKLIPSMVVDLFLQNGVRHVRVFNQLTKTSEPFVDSGITFSIGISNNVLERFTNNTETRQWVQTRIKPYTYLNIKYVMVGSEPFSASFLNKTYDNAVDVLRLMQNTLNSLNYSKVKASIPHYSDVLVLNKTSKPSEADFRPDIKERMVESIRILKQNNAPFMVGMYPIHYVHTQGIDLEFAFIDNKSDFVVKDDATGHVYTNAFEFLFDSYHWAVAKAGGEDLKIIVTTIGWPTDGYPGTSVKNAERFYKGLLPLVTSNKGTPMRPGYICTVYPMKTITTWI